MAGRITVSTLNNDTGVLATQNGMTGIAKAWVQFGGGNGNTAGTINGSFNVSSITVNGTGDYTVNFTNNMSSANYCAVVFGGKSGVAFGLGLEATAAPTAAAYRFLTYGSSFTVTDTPNNCVAIFST